MNVLWEMGACERVLQGVLEGAKGLIHGVTCGAGMPYRLAEIAAKYDVYYYPIVSSARAFRALWKRAYHRLSDRLGGVVCTTPGAQAATTACPTRRIRTNPSRPIRACASCAPPCAVLWADHTGDHQRRRRPGICATGATGSTTPSSDRSVSSSEHDRS